MIAPEGAERDEALAAQYVLDVLPPEQRTTFEARLWVEPDLDRKVQAWCTKLSRLAEALPGVEPPSEVWRRIETALDEAATTRARRSRQPGGDPRDRHLRG